MERQRSVIFLILVYSGKFKQVTIENKVGKPISISMTLYIKESRYAGFFFITFSIVFKSNGISMGFVRWAFIALY